MQTSLLRVFLVILCCRAAAGLAGDPAPHLDIFLLSEVSLPDYRLIDTPAYPRLGYVAQKSDLVISHLKGVSINAVPDSTTPVQSAGAVAQSRTDASSLELRLTLADAEALEVFSAANVGKKIVFMLGGKPLFAPILRTPLSTQTVQITPPEGADLQDIKRELEALIRKPK